MLKNGDFEMIGIRHLAATIVAVGFAATSAAAQAQTAMTLSNGTELTLSNTQSSWTGITNVDLGSAGVTGVVTQMPLSLTYESVAATISFTGSSSLYYGTTSGVAMAPVSTNYLRAGSGSTVTMDFSTAQRFFSMSWGTQGNGDSVAFYNGDQLISSVAGSTIRPSTIALTGTSTGYTEFSFGELGFDRVVFSGGTTIMEVGALAFSEAPQPAPVPLNATSLGGLLTFLMMAAAHGGALRTRLQALALRMAKSQQLQRFA